MVRFKPDTRKAPNREYKGEGEKEGRGNVTPERTRGIPLFRVTTVLGWYHYTAQAIKVNAGMGLA